MNTTAKQDSTNEFAKTELGKALQREMSRKHEDDRRSTAMSRLYARLSAMSVSERTVHLQGRFDALVEDDISRPKDILLYHSLMLDALVDECHPLGSSESHRQFVARHFELISQATMNRPEILNEKGIAGRFINDMLFCWKDTPSIEDAKDFLARLVRICRAPEITRYTASEIRHATVSLDRLYESYTSLDTERRARVEGVDEDAPTRDKFIGSIVHSVASRLRMNGQSFFMQLLPKIDKLRDDGVNRVMLAVDRELFMAETKTIIEEAMKSALKELRGRWLEDGQIAVIVELRGATDANLFVSLQYENSDYSHVAHVEVARAVIDRLKDKETVETIRSGNGLAPFIRKLSVEFTDAHHGAAIKHRFEI
jgi:hypothetical protein